MSQERILKEGEQFSVILFEVGGEEFAIDLLDVQEIIQTGQIRRLPQSFDFIEGIYNYRGNIIHIINMKKKLKLSDYRIYKKDTGDNSSQKFIIIVNINETTIGFYVDRIVKVAQIDTNKLIGLSPIFQTSITNVEYVKGIIKFEDRPRIFIDLHKILSESEQLSIQQNQKSLV
jgi:purine-binding chemotaxis protein CheW